MKRKAKDFDHDSQDDLTPRKTRRATLAAHADDDLRSEESTPSKPSRVRPLHSTKKSESLLNSPDISRVIVDTPKSKRKLLFVTPTKSQVDSSSKATPSLVRNADRSARRKSARTLIERAIAGDLSDDNDFEKEDDLAHQIRDEESEGSETQLGPKEIPEFDPLLPSTPSKRPRGRPKSSQRKKSPTPPQNLPPHEQYFFQNRPNSNKTSSNTLASLSLLSHSDYHTQISNYTDPHASSISYLHSLHSRSFPQWVFELSESFSICLYGYGSKRSLVHSFVNYIHTNKPSTSLSPTTIIINAYLPTLTLRAILTTIITSLPASSFFPSKLPSDPTTLLSLLLTHLTSHSPPYPIYLFINSFDSPSLRRSAAQSLLASLSSHPSVYLLVTCDTPSFPLLWDITLRTRFNWVFHDTTTFVPFDDGKGTGEISTVVDSVNELFGRKGGSGKGREGVKWVLKSLPEKARGLYRVLLAEILAMSSDEVNENTGIGNGYGGSGDENEGHLQSPPTASTPRKRKAPVDEAASLTTPAIEYRILYQKAVEEFLCGSEMEFRLLMKEFVDHQMVVSRRGDGGREVLGCPLRREEMEGVLEDLLVE